MQNCFDVAAEDLGKRFRIHSDWIDEYQVAWPGNLDQRQLRVIRPLPMELSVDGVAIGIKELLDDFV